MKRLFLISATVILASACLAQTDISGSSLYKFDNRGMPKEIRTLGSAPEFRFLRNLTSQHQVYAAIKKHENDNTPDMNKLNDLLMQIGYTNGTKDLQPSDITKAYIKPGTEGNMGSAGHTYGYCRLKGNPSEFKAWEITPKDNNTNGPLYVFAKCGNAFYPRTEKKTACINVPVQVTPDESQIKLQSSGSEVTTNDKVYVYYARKHHKKGETANTVPGINDEYPSKPIMVDATKNEDVIPETYSVTLSNSQNTVSACADSTLNLTANINVEKTSTYTGNYPKDDHKVYKKVSKRQYKMITRKMRKADRKANKIAKRTGVPVDVKLTKV